MYYMPRPRNNAHRKKKKHSRTFLFVEWFLLVGFITFFVATGALLLWASTLNIPDIQSFEQRKVVQSTKIYDRTGKILLYDLHGDVQRTVIPFKSISDYVKNATVAIEDEEFYQHHGVKPLSFLRAVLANLRTGRFSQGGSTITQQVVKNSLLTSQKLISRKLKEWVLAVKLERVLTKDQILDLYLNEAPYGGNIYGVEEASQTYFGKPSSDLTLAEAAYLAALPQAPTYYSPYGIHKDDLDARQRLVLDRMLVNGYITEEEHDAALTEKVTFLPQNDTGIKAPHFVMFIRQYLAEKYGEQALEERGFKVITTLDYELQAQAEEIAQKYALENVGKYNASNAGIVAVDPKTGQILVMVGSRNYFDDQIDGNFNVTLAKRQPGSSFKPFVYATALKKGYTPDTVVFDVATQFSTTCAVDDLKGTDESEGDCYAPVNFDGKYQGPITMRNALAQSVNIPAIKFLYLSGLRSSLETAKVMGISTLSDAAHYGLTLVLGGGEVTLLDMANAYGVFANEGVRNPYTGILSIEDSDGNMVEQFTPNPEQVLPKQTALQITDILSDNVARTPEFGAQSYLNFPGHYVADKTGTTNDYRDAWIIGYTPTIAVGAWAGNNDNSPMEKKIAGFIVAPMWNAFMYRVFEKYPDQPFEQPLPESSDLKPILKGIWQGGLSYYIDTISGKRATEYTPEELKKEQVIPDVHSILNWVNKDDPRGPIPVNPSLDPQYKYWEYGVNKWKTENGYGTSTISVGAIPTDTDDVHRPEYDPSVSVINFDVSRIYSMNEPLTIRLDIQQKKYPIAKVDYFINESFVESKTGNFSEISFIPGTIQGITRNNTLKIVVYDSVLNKTEIFVPFSVAVPQTNTSEQTN